MSEMSRQTRREMRAKAHRLTQQENGKVDASDYGPEETEHAEVKTGARPLTRRRYKSGGKVEGADAAQNAGKKPRTGNKALTADGYLNRDTVEANDEREGYKHVGAFKRGGRAEKADGGVPATRFNMGANTGSRMTQAAGLKRGGSAKHPDEKEDRSLVKKMVKKEALTGKNKGGSVSDGELEGTRPTGGRLARKSGGRAKGNTDINIIIGRPSPAGAPPMGLGAPGGAAAPVPVGPPGLGAAGPAIPTGAPPAGPGGPPPPPMPIGRKAGGRVHMTAGAKSGLGRLQKAEIAKRDREG